MNLFMLALAMLMQATNPCDTNATGPFLVTSAKPYTIQFCTAQTNTAPDGTVVPEIIDGFYFSLDGAQRQDIGKPQSLGPSTATKRDAWQYIAPSGVSKGDHTATITAYNYVRDANGNPTTTRQDGPATSIPFTAVDPVYNLPPQAITGGRIIK